MLDSQWFVCVLGLCIYIHSLCVLHPWWHFTRWGLTKCISFVLIKCTIHLCFVDSNNWKCDNGPCQTIFSACPTPILLSLCVYVCFQVLVQYLEEVDDLEIRYQLALEVNTYDTALECLKGLKDRERVRAFINCVPVNKQYEYRPKIDRILSNSVSNVLRWLIIWCVMSWLSCSKSSGSIHESVIIYVAIIILLLYIVAFILRYTLYSRRHKS